MKADEQVGYIDQILTKADRDKLREAWRNGEVQHVDHGRWSREPLPIAVLKRLGLSFQASPRHP